MFFYGFERNGGVSLQLFDIVGDDFFKPLIGENKIAFIDCLNIVCSTMIRETPLCEACYSGDKIAVELLLKYGANPSIVNRDGQTLLEYAYYAYRINERTLYGYNVRFCYI